MKRDSDNDALRSERARLQLALAELGKLKQLTPTVQPEFQFVPASFLETVNWDGPEAASAAPLSPVIATAPPRATPSVPPPESAGGAAPGMSVSDCLGNFGGEDTPAAQADDSPLPAIAAPPPGDLPGTPPMPSVTRAFDDFVWE